MDYSAANTALWNFIIQMGLIAGAVILANVLRRKIALIRKGLMPGHLERICGDYREQLNAMLDGFRFFPEGTVHTVPQGGLFVWAALPEGTDAMKVFEAAVQNDVAFVPGTHFYTEGGHLNTLRLNFSMSDIPTIEAGMSKLGRVISAVTNP